MDVSPSLLVILMFVTILGMGIANLIMGLAAVVNQESSGRPTLVHLGWIALLLLWSFNLFWHSLSIAEIEDWSFLGFLYIVAGPTLVVFAVSGILPAGPAEPEPGKRERYLALRPHFFPLFAMAQAWVVIADIFLLGGFVLADLENLFMVGLAVYLWRTDDYDKHILGVRIAWACFALVAALYGLGIVH